MKFLVKTLTMPDHIKVWIFRTRRGAHAIETVEDYVFKAKKQVQVYLHLGGFSAFMETGGVGVVDSAEQLDIRLNSGLSSRMSQSLGGLQNFIAVVVAGKRLALGQ